MHDTKFALHEKTSKYMASHDKLWVHRLGTLNHMHPTNFIHQTYRTIQWFCFWETFARKRPKIERVIFYYKFATKMNLFVKF